MPSPGSAGSAGSAGSFTTPIITPCPTPYITPYSPTTPSPGGGSSGPGPGPACSPEPDYPPQPDGVPNIYLPSEDSQGTGSLFVYSKYKDATFNFAIENIFGNIVDDPSLIYNPYYDSFYYNVSLYTVNAETGLNNEPYLVSGNFIENRSDLDYVLTQEINAQAFEEYYGLSGAQRYYKLLTELYNRGLKNSVLTTVYHQPAIISEVDVEDGSTLVPIGTGEESGYLTGYVNINVTFTGGIGESYIVKSVDIYTGRESGYCPYSLTGFSFLKTVDIFDDFAEQTLKILPEEVISNETLFYRLVPFDDFGAGIPFPHAMSGYLAYSEPLLDYSEAIPPVLDAATRLTGYFSGLNSPQKVSERDGAIIFQDDDNLGQNFYILKSGQWQTLAIYEEISGRLPYPASSGQAFSGNANDVYLSPSGLRDAFSAWGEAPLFASRAWANFDGGRTTLAGTFSRVNYTVTVDIANHGLSVGDIARLDGTVIGWNTTGYIVDSVTNVNQFTFTHNSNGTDNGSVNLYKNPIRAAGNVSSIASIANGDHLVNFINPMPDENYAASVYAFTVDASPESLFLARSGFAPNADYFKFRITNNSPAGVNVPYVMLNIVR
ncbi:MAG: hypothetical protein ACO3GY_07125 [Flavobacteriaceae bacterium]